MSESVQNAAALFVGSFTHSLDDKRRMIFPSSWRNLAGASNQLFAFPLEEVSCGLPGDKQDEQAIRSITAGAEMLVWDAQGRLRIGENLLAHVEAKSQLVLVGAMTRIELWSAENFDLALPQDSAVAENVFFGGY